VRFGVFELDERAGELRRGGRRVALQPQPLEILRALLERPGEVVTREQLRSRLWSNGAYVDFDRSLNKAIVKLRDALGDDADSPRYIETLPRHGYRFIPLPQVQARLDAALPAQCALTAGMPQPEGPASPQLTPVSRVQTAGAHHGWRWVALGLSLLALAGWIISSWFGIERGGTKPVEPTNFQQPAQRTAEAAPAIHSLAVLPLENLSGDKEQQYFAEGMTDALTTDLAQIGSLRVISRTSAMQFKDSKKSLREIGHDLQVDAVVEGTVVRDDNRVRITAQLIETSSDHHLWAKSYERDLKDTLALQDEIAQDVAEQIRAKLTSRERSLLTKVHAVDPEAHDAYLKGRYWWHAKTLDGSQKSLDYFQKAIAKDPTYALAYAGLADTFVSMAWNFHLPAKEAFPKVKEAAIKAVELDPSLAEAHASLASAQFSYYWDWTVAEHEFKQAIALNPNYAQAYHYYSYYLMAMGRLDEAVNGFEHARNLDPYAFHINWSLGTALYFARRYDEALRQYQRCLEMFPDRRADLYDSIANVYEQKKMFAEAFAAHQQALSIKKDPTATVLDQAYQRSGYSGYVRKKIEILEKAPPPQGDLLHWYALANDDAHVMTFLERLYEERFPWLLMLQVDPRADFIRSSPRFRNLVHRIGLPQSSSDVRTTFLDGYPAT
jgi:TolB-like protein/DNA-binding winged helix-turn-helix (wHTH) protein/Tfp pilus assembly protein PilF